MQNSLEIGVGFFQFWDNPQMVSLMMSLLCSPLQAANVQFHFEGTRIDQCLFYFSAMLAWQGMPVGDMHGRSQGSTKCSSAARKKRARPRLPLAD